MVHVQSNQPYVLSQKKKKKKKISHMLKSYAELGPLHERIPNIGKLRR